ncbi:MAG TPA: SDR family oxidoreductase [Cyclobacteriaceae bacterium]|nr:SDR family oxidoreductase [Cyclobacteriaceae bacterium]
MPWLKDKGIVIVGGTSGIGLSAARAFIEEGAGVVAIGRDDQLAGEASRILKNRGEVVVGDAAEEDVAEKGIEKCLEKFKRFNGLYHVAGGSGRKFGDGPLHEITLEGWNKTMEMNLTSLMLSNRAAVRSFRKLDTAGTILNMASVLAYSPSPSYFSTHAYAASKAAIIGLTKSIASYYAKDNIRINAIAPALVETPMAQRAANDETIMSFIKTKQPLDGGRVGTPNDLDGAAVYFLSDQSKFTTGQVLSVDGGWHLSEGQY